MSTGNIILFEPSLGWQYLRQPLFGIVMSETGRGCLPEDDYFVSGIDPYDLFHLYGDCNQS